MKTFVLGFSLMLVTCVVHSTNNEQIKQKDPTSLKTENLVNPIGIGDANPRFSWIDTSLERGWIQSAYQIIVASSEADIETNTGDMWNSGKVASLAQSGIKYAGSPLQPGTKYWWKVRVYDQRGNVSSYSSAATFETGL
ncbi:MAG: alpha-rhamnosidase, partial [Bacteroidales bacterium]|nr:alpha-rhamnosidase [Bacteroidales bacterium]